MLEPALKQASGMTCMSPPLHWWPQNSAYVIHLFDTRWHQCTLMDCKVKQREQQRAHPQQIAHCACHLTSREPVCRGQLPLTNAQMRFASTLTITHAVKPEEQHCVPDAPWLTFISFVSLNTWQKLSRLTVLDRQPALKSCLCRNWRHTCICTWTHSKQESDASVPYLSVTANKASLWEIRSYFIRIIKRSENHTLPITWSYKLHIVLISCSTTHWLWLTRHPIPLQKTGRFSIFSPLTTLLITSKQTWLGRS